MNKKQEWTDTIKKISNEVFENKFEINDNTDIVAQKCFDDNDPCLKYLWSNFSIEYKNFEIYFKYVNTFKHKSTKRTYVITHAKVDNKNISIVLTPLSKDYKRFIALPHIKKAVNKINENNKKRIFFAVYAENAKFEKNNLSNNVVAVSNKSIREFLVFCNSLSRFN